MTTILVIEDDAFLRSALRRILRLLGHEVLEAAEGEEGIRRFREHPVEIVITDIFMPGMDGIETIGELRRIEPQAKIIAISGGGQRRDLSFLGMARKFGADRTLAKPFSTEEILAAVEDLLERDLVGWA